MPPTGDWSKPYHSVKQGTQESTTAESLHGLVPSIDEREEASKKSIDKKVDVVKKYPLTLNNGNNHSDLIPTRYNLSRVTNTYLSTIKTDQTKLVSEISQDRNNITLRFKLAQNSLFMAEICRILSITATLDSKKEEHARNAEEYLKRAREENQCAKILNAFYAPAYYIEAMVKEYEGIDCKNLPEVKKYIQLLKIVLALDPELTEAQETLQKTVEFLKARWDRLAKEEKIDSTTYQNWLEQLNQWLSQDALAALFTNHPELFQLAKQARYSAFFNQHPEFKSIDTFFNKHPEAGIIKIHELSKEGVHAALAQAESDPLALRLPMISKTDILTPAVANEIKDGMLKYFEKGKILKVYVGNDDDVYTIVNSFKNDTSLARGHGSIEDQLVELKNYSFPVHIISINPNKPFIRA
jgi:hypothetical protein